MRTGGTFNVAAEAPAAPVQHSPWHSPVPYLFGGLAAMLGLIAFALLILACSYWKLSGYLDGGEGGTADGDSESGSGDGRGDDAMKGPLVFEEAILVVMAGQQKATFLATPAFSKASSFNSEKNEKSEEVAVKKQGSDDHVHPGNGETHEPIDQSH